MSGVLCEGCGGMFPSSKHPCGAKLLKELNEQIVDKHRYLDILNETCKERDLARKEVEKLNLELMARDVHPDFERGEYHGQDQMLIHIVKLREDSNSLLAQAVRDCPMFKDRCRLLRQVADYLTVASFKLGEAFDPAAAKDCHNELSILQKRAEMFGGDDDKAGF